MMERARSENAFSAQNDDKPFFVPDAKKEDRSRDSRHRHRERSRERDGRLVSSSVEKFC